MNAKPLAKHVRCHLPAGLLALLLVLFHWPAAAAQTTPDLQTRAKLKQPVHLALGQCTVANFTAALARQCGVPIRAEAYLQERVVIAQMDHLSAQDALDSLAELNGWRWYLDERHTVILAPPRVHLPQKPEEITPALQSALPLDVRQYFGVAVSLEELANGVKAEERSQFTAPEVRAHPRLAPVGDLVARKASGEAKSRRMLLLQQLQPDLARTSTLPFQKLNAEQQQMLVTVHILKNLSEANSNFYALLSGTLDFRLLDASDMEIRLEGGNFLNVGKTIHEGKYRYYAGGGGEVAGLKPVGSPVIPPSP